MNARIQELAEQAELNATLLFNKDKLEKFAQLIIQECVNKIELYEVPCGNSAAGEMASEWTMQALEQVRDEIREVFGAQS